MLSSRFLRIFISYSHVFIVFLWVGGTNAAASTKSENQSLTVAGYVVASNGKAIDAENIDKHLVPASVLKLVSSQLAINKWGIEYQFETDFYLHEGWLWVRGKGDPFFVSEEMDSFIVDFLQRFPDLKNLKGIGVDGRYFADTWVQGRDGKNDPYNAPLSAVAANFNTVYIRKKNGQLSSAESKTPLTKTAIRLSKALPNGKHRVNLVDSKTAQRYFAELLQLKLHEVGLQVGEEVKLGALPTGAQLIISHQNSRALGEVLRGALEYSNNFISNMLFIQLCDSHEVSNKSINEVPNNGHSMLTASKCAEEQLKQQYSHVFDRAKDANWNIVEGAGLSRRNKMNAEQIMAMLAVFAPHKSLMKSYHQGRVRAKTGTLRGVRTFAGYISHTCGDVRFVFMYEGSGLYRKREQALADLIQRMDKTPERLCG